MFPPRCFADDSAVRPAQFAEMYRQRNPGQARGGGRAASFADWNLVVDVERERLHRFASFLQHFPIGRQYEVVFDPAADIGVTTSRRDGKLVRGRGADFQEQSEGNRCRVKRRPQIGGRGGQHKLD